MAISLKDPEADRLAREVADRTGETLTAAIIVALRERLARLKGRGRRNRLRDELQEIARRCRPSTIGPPTRSLGTTIEDCRADGARTHVAIARRAYRRFDRGRPAAGLNFGDLFAYALAHASGEPLLFKGEDFARTDVRRAL